MSAGIPIEPNMVPPRGHFGARVCAVCLSVALIATFGCVAGEHKQDQVTQPPTNQSAPQAPTTLDLPHKRDPEEVQEAAPELSEGSGQTAWAKGFEGDLIQGLDGELYVAYNAETIEHVQFVMKNRGLYLGPVNGVLDPPTMESIYTFQKANAYLLHCGVPTPITRKLLEQGSHTDISS